MKSCPTCNNSYDDATVFCPADGSTLITDSARDDLIGSVVADRYLVTGMIGQGGMGSVYLAQHVRLPQKVAIKVLHPSLSSAPDMIARFNREALNASSISNEHVARVYDFGEMGGLLYLAMEFVEGETLGAMLNRTASGILPFDRVSRIVSMVADGLDAAHKLGIVHRDLKPDNILVSSDIDGDHLKIVDFGIAKAAHVKTQSVTQTGFAIGTAEFMSPEQLMGESVDQRADVYSLGLVTFLLLTGKLPFQGETKEKSMLMRLTHEPLKLGEVRPDMVWPAPIQSAVSKALARDAKERYNSAGEFARAFDNAVNTRVQAAAAVPQMAAAPFPGTPSVAAASAASAPRRRPMRWIAAAGAAVFVVAVVAFALNGNRNGNGNDSGNNNVLVPLPPASVATTDSAKTQVATKVDSGTASKTSSVAPRKAAVDPPVPAKAAAVTPPAARDSVPPMSAEVKQMLENIEYNTDALRMTAESARQALLDIAVVLPKLRTRRDSGTVEMQRIEAHIKLDQISDACKYIRELLPKVASGDLRALQNYERLCR